MESIDRFVEMRRKNATLYNAGLKDIPGITLPQERDWAKNVYWMFGILTDDRLRITRDSLMQRLKEKGIDTRTFFIPMHMQPAFLNMGLFEGESYPVATELSEKGLYLPSGSGLKPEEIDYVCTCVRNIASGV
jgi:perosamine synthetase